MTNSVDGKNYGGKMSNSDERQILFSYYPNSESKTKSKIKVEYISESLVSNEEFKRLYCAFVDCLNNNTSDDIVEVATKIKELFQDLEEYSLDIIIRDEDYLQEVKYLEGKVDSCCFSIKNWDDIICVNNTYTGTSIQYKKRGKYIYNPESAGVMYSELDKFFQKIFGLYELEKRDEFVKVKKLEK